MYTPEQALDPVVGARIDADRREETPTPVWHLAKSANVDEKAMMHHLGSIGIKPFRWGNEMLWHVDKPSVRELMGIEGE